MNIKDKLIHNSKTYPLILTLSCLPLFLLFLQLLGFNYQFSFIITNQLIRWVFCFSIYIWRLHLALRTCDLISTSVLFDLFKYINIFVKLKVAGTNSQIHQVSATEMTLW